MDEVQKLMHEMFRSYCRLVRQYALGNYSRPVQLAILQIDSDLTEDLTLAALAETQNLNPSYLSALFRKETGQTITSYVNDRRVKLAMHLLRTTTLQIQSIAQYCGILDVRYFTRLFKKSTGKTPKEYRQQKSEN